MLLPLRAYNHTPLALHVALSLSHCPAFTLSAIKGQLNGVAAERGTLCIVLLELLLGSLLTSESPLTCVFMLPMSPDHKARMARGICVADCNIRLCHIPLPTLDHTLLCSVLRLCALAGLAPLHRKHMLHRWPHDGSLSAAAKRRRFSYTQ
jgi:hypothetical protein